MWLFVCLRDGSCVCVFAYLRVRVFVCVREWVLAAVCVIVCYRVCDCICVCVRAHVLLYVCVCLCVAVCECGSLVCWL